MANGLTWTREAAIQRLGTKRISMTYVGSVIHIVSRRSPFPLCCSARLRAYRTFLSICLLAASSFVPFRVVAQTATIPVALDVTTSQAQIGSGQSMRVDVKLRNAFNIEVPAPEPTLVTIKTSFSAEIVQIVIPAGQSSGGAELHFRSAGVGSVEATATRLSAGTARVVVVENAPRAEASSPSSNLRSTEIASDADRTYAAYGTSHRQSKTAAKHREGGGEPLDAPLTPHAPDTVPSRSGSGSAGGGSVKTDASAPPGSGSPPTLPGSEVTSIRLDVLPPRIHPHTGNWESKIWVAALDAHGVPLPAPQQLKVRFAAELGKVSPVETAIPAGSATNVDEVQLVSKRAGQDVVRAWLSTGAEPVRCGVEYEKEEPTKLLLDVHPKKALNSGQTPVIVTVLLQDELNHCTSTDKPLTVTLTATQGHFQPSEIIIPSGKFSGEATLTSSIQGKVTVTARTEGMEDRSEVEFTFPWKLVIFAALGGLLGALLRDSKNTFSRRWFHYAWRNLLVGIVLGMVFYGLTLFGAVGSVSKIIPSIDVSVIPTVNELGAILLGFAGGYFGRRILDVKKVNGGIQPNLTSGTAGGSGH